jgi:pilus assembly protein CpaB
MNTRAFTLALIIAIAAMFMVQTYIEGEKSKIVKNYGTPKTVIIAKVDIKELELIDDSKIIATSIPASFVHESAFNKIEDLANTIATVPIQKGEQITKPRVTYPGAKTGLSRQVSIGKRAYALQVTAKQAVSKLIRPGDRVDVITGIDYSDGDKRRQKTVTVLQDVLILSTGLSMTNSIPIIGVKVPKAIKRLNLNVYEKYNTITLELEPYQVQKIVFMLKYAAGDIHLSLRNNNDKKNVRLTPTKIFDLLGEKDAAEAKAYYEEKYRKDKGR